jgi:hypothetical protein
MFLPVQQPSTLSLNSSRLKTAFEGVNVSNMPYFLSVFHGLISYVAHRMAGKRKSGTPPDLQGGL